MECMRSQKGFTMVELLIVIAILGILTLIAVPRYIDLSDTVKTTAFISDIRVMEGILHVYSLTRDTPPDTGPENPGQKTDEEWNQYAAAHLGDFVVGGWPTSTPWGGYYTYRAYPDHDAWSYRENWKSVDGNQPISEVAGEDPFEILMIRFVDPANEEAFNKTQEALLNSKYGNRVYRYDDEFNLGVLVLYNR